MIKKIVRKIINSLGFDIVRLYDNTQRSVNSKALSYYQTTTGNYFLPTDAINDGVAYAIKNNQIFEQEVVDLASSYITPDSTVLDVGSNFGQMAILYSRITGPKGRVHAFDADDFIFDILKKNIEANNLNNVIIPHFGAVYDKLGETLFFPIQDFVRFQTYGSYGIDYNGKEGREVPSITIDSLNIQEPISFMKVDVQGGDLQAMRGAVETIKKHKMPILFEYDCAFEDEFNYTFQDYVDFVSSINYKFVKVVSGHNYLILPIQ